MAEKCSLYQLINKKEDLLLLSNAYKKGKINLNKSKIAKLLEYSIYPTSLINTPVM